MTETIADNPQASFIVDCETGETTEIYVGTITKAWAETIRATLE